MTTTTKIWLIGVACGGIGVLAVVGAVSYIRNH